MPTWIWNTWFTRSQDLAQRTRTWKGTWKRKISLAFNIYCEWLQRGCWPPHSETTFAEAGKAGYHIPLTLTASFFSLNANQVWSRRLLPRDPGKWKVRRVLTEAKHHTKDEVLCGYLQVFEKDSRKSGSLTWKGRWMQMDHLQITADSSICSIKTVLRSGKTSPKIWLQLSPGKLRGFKTTSTQDQPVTTAAIIPVAVADSFFFFNIKKQVLVQSH